MIPVMFFTTYIFQMSITVGEPPGILSIRNILRVLETGF